jgi:endoglucanase
MIMRPHLPKRLVSVLAALFLSAAGAGAATVASSTAANAATGCSAVYSVVNQWNTGFTAGLTVTNSGTTAITGWTVTYTYPSGGSQVLQQTGWSGNWSQSGLNVTVTNAAWNGSLAPGAQATGVGANFNYTGTNTAPSSVTCTPQGGTTGNTVTVTNPGSRTGTVGTAVSLQIQASDSAAGQTLTYSATGLPAGLAISSSGLISGTPTAAGTSSVTVTARDGTGASGSATFRWSIIAATSPTINTTATSLSVAQSGTGTVGISLSAAPSANVTVTTTRTSGNTGLSVSGGGTLTFTPANFATAQNVTFAADASSTGSATFTVSATGIPSVTITVTETTVSTGGAAQLHVSGNKLLDASGNQVILRGINRSGTEYACVQGNGIFDGEVDQAAVTAMKSWKVNAVRVPLNEACWNGESYVPAADAGTNYINAIKSWVSLLNSNGLDVILDLHWTDGDYTGNSAGNCSGHPEQEAFCQKPMPDAAQAIPFWTSVANTFKGNNSVLFDLFNEPFASRADNNNSAEGWQCWATGSPCTGISYPVAGMQQMVNAVRGTGATNVIMLGGEEFSNDLTSLLANLPTDPQHNLVASWHSYNFNTCSSQSCWTSQIQPVIAQIPVIAGEIGENDCAGSYINPLTTWLDSQNTSYLAWAWNADFQCSSGPGLITDYVPGTPTAYGAAYKAHLAALSP